MYMSEFELSELVQKLAWTKKIRAFGHIFKTTYHPHSNYTSKTNIPIIGNPCGFGIIIIWNMFFHIKNPFEGVLSAAISCLTEDDSLVYTAG